MLHRTMLLSCISLNCHLAKYKFCILPTDSLYSLSCILLFADDPTRSTGSSANGIK